MTDPLDLVESQLASGLLREATSSALQTLDEAPNDPRALSLFGRILLESGQPLVAAMMLDRAAAAGASDLPTRYALALALEAAGDREGAESHLRRAEASDPLAILRRVHLLVRGGRAEEAVALLDPEDARPFVLVHRAHALLAANQATQAQAAYARAVAADPSVREWHGRWVGELRYVGLVDEANAALERGLVFEPDDGELLHLAAAESGTLAGRAPDGYVETTFDRFAETFDVRLRNELEYRVPEKIEALLARELGPPQRSLDILDLGCGTGICGEVLFERARRLDGIDISAQMLARAHARGCYDTLTKAELTDALRHVERTYGLVVAADVLIYFAEPDELFGLIADVLDRDGIFAFSLERGDAAVELGRTGRFAHGLQATLESLAAVGMSARHVEETTLRLEHAAPVGGYLILAAGSAS